MALPKIDVPLYSTKIPSTGNKINIRPLTVKEEKILLLAQESKSFKQILLSIKQIVNNCIQTAGVDVDKLALFDIEYLFLRLRSVSMGNVVSVSYRDNSDKKAYSFDIDLDQIDINVPKKPNFKIKLSESKHLLLKYPSIDMFDKMPDNIAADQDLEILGTFVLDKLYDGDEVYDFNDYTIDEVKEFVENIDLQTFKKISSFIENIPSISHTLEYTNENGEVRKIVLKGIGDFFL